MGESDWGGSEKDRLKKPVNPHGANAKDLADATAYQRYGYGAREFKGGSPLYPGKGSTIVKKEGMLNNLKKQYGNLKKQSGILNEDSLIKDDESLIKE